MKTGMTERDKRLLVFMFMVVIIVGIGYWGILPQIRAFNNLEPKIAEEEQKEQTYQAKKSTLPTLEVQIEEYETKIESETSQFYGMMKSSEVDRMMTEIAVSNILDVYDLEFSMSTSPSDRQPYQYSELIEIRQQLISELEAEEESDSDDSSMSADEEIERALELEAEFQGTDTTDITGAVFDDTSTYVENQYIYAVPVSMTVGGDVDNIHDFINDIIGLGRKVLLVSYDWEEYREIRNADEVLEDADESSDEGVSAVILSEDDPELENKKALTVNLEIYMYDDTTTVDTTSEGIED